MAIAAIAVGGASGAVTSRFSPVLADYREALVVQHLPLSLDPLLGGREDPARLLRRKRHRGEYQGNQGGGTRNRHDEA